MGSGYGEGDNRAQEAAQEAISSPLLEDISIAGAQGVLLNITGGMDLAIDEVTQISTIIQEEVGDEAEIIFGAVHDPGMEGKVRITLIATGFETADDQRVIRPDFRRPAMSASTREIATSPAQEEQQRAQLQIQAAMAGGGPPSGVVPLNRFSERVVTREIGELDIPTFIRRQMD